MDNTNQRNDAIFWKEQGDAYFKSQNYDEAIRCYKKALEIDNEYINAWNNYGYALYKQGRLEEAEKIKEKIKILKNLSKDKPIQSNFFDKYGIFFGIFLCIFFILIVAFIFPKFYTESTSFIQPISSPITTYTPEPSPTHTLLTTTPTKSLAYSIQNEKILQGQSGNSIVIIYGGDWWLNAISTGSKAVNEKEYDVEGSGNEVISLAESGFTIDGCLMRLDNKKEDMCIGIVRSGTVISLKCSEKENLVCFSGDF